MVDPLYGGSAITARIEAWAAATGFGGQIYADFWGYSTMAVGLARMFNIEIPVNFDRPYLAWSIRDFWRRWHMTLSRWLRDYLYKPLGGSQYGKLRTFCALMATMILGGLWHGANYTFIVWGGIHGLALGAEHLVSRERASRLESRKRSLGIYMVRGIGWIYAMVVVSVSWVFFRAPDMSHALSIIMAMAKGPSANASHSVKQIAVLVIALFLIQFPFEWLLRMFRKEEIPPWIGVVTSFVLVLGAVVLGAPEAVPFIYFQGS
jgi:D-alanyl-lipoteichoic acid acyltransferase DltB (MBOAT superfamily)